MTISAVVPDIAFAGSSGSGTLGPFSLVKSGTPLVFFSNSEVVVLRYDSVTDTTPTLLVEGTHYTLTGGPTAGSITLISPSTGLLTAERLYVTTVSALAQTLDLVNGGNFSSSNLERRLDVIFQILQQHAREIKSTIRFAMFDTDEIPKTTPLGAVLDKIPYVTGTASAPTVAYLDAEVLADLSELGDTNLANIATVAADLAGADTIGIVAAAIDDVEDVADNIADVSAVADALTSGVAGALEVTSTGSTTARTLAVRFAEQYSVKDFGATGDGTTDDTTAIQSALDYIKANGGILYFPAGTYNVTALLAVASATKPFWIRGAGRENTKFVRASDFNGSMLSINTSNNWSVSDLTLDAKHSIRSDGNHGLVWYNCSHVRVQRVVVTDWKNSAILGYTDPASTSYENNIIEDCWVDGLDAANNGILLADLVKSGIRNSYAVNIGKSGSPCYGLQLKNGCQDCFIEGGAATDALIGVACGNYDASGTHTRNIINGVNIYNCTAGLAFGTAIGNRASNLVIDMNTAGNHPVDFNQSSVGCSVVGVSVRNLASNKAAVRFRSGDTDNVAIVDTIANSSGVVQFATTFDSGSLRNSMTLRRYVNPTTVASTTNLVDNSSGSATNTFVYEALPQRQSATIASGAVAVRDAKVSLMRLDTESAAASDDLDSITGGTDGQVITLETTSNVRDVVVKHLAAGGNIRLSGLADFTMDGVADSLTLIFKSALSQWCEVARGNNV